MNFFQKWRLKRQLKSIESNLKIEYMLALTCDHCSSSIIHYTDARHCANCDRYFCQRCAGLGMGSCPICKSDCGINKKVMDLHRERDRIEAEIGGLG